MRVAVPRAVFRYIEHLLYSHEADRETYGEVREAIIHESGGEVVAVRGGEITDATGRKAAQLVDSWELVMLARQINSIECVLRERNVYRELYELKYKEGLGWREVCDKMHVSESTYRRVRRALVCRVGRTMRILRRE